MTENNVESTEVTIPVGSETPLSPGEMARELTERLLDLGGMEAEVKLVDEDQKVVNLSVDGPDASALVGRQGQVLNAFQNLIGLLLNRRLDQRMIVNVDADSYRAKRAEALVQAAKDLAGQVREAGEEAVMDPLNAAERRIVHTALMEEPGIRTYSEGEEPDRRVVISPSDS